jgi:hypothetical protein
MATTTSAPRGCLAGGRGRGREPRTTHDVYSYREGRLSSAASGTSPHAAVSASRTAAPRPGARAARAAPSRTPESGLLSRAWEVRPGLDPRRNASARAPRVRFTGRRRSAPIESRSAPGSARADRRKPALGGAGGPGARLPDMNPRRGSECTRGAAATSSLPQRPHLSPATARAKAGHRDKFHDASPWRVVCFHRSR